MTLFPNAKINIGLYITGKRDDGYHNIESMFYPLCLTDALEFVLGEPGRERDDLIETGYRTEGIMEDNLVIRALNLVREEFTIPPLKIHLHKSIPPGSGLGGGSADAAFMLKYLNRYFSLGYSEEILVEKALRLGSDCAFFIGNRPSYISGRGELIKEAPQILKDKYIVIVYPGIHISTSEAYRMIKPGHPVKSLAEKLNMPLSSWKENVKNDFQDVIIDKHPEIANIIDKIYKSGAVYSSLSGSGSSVYGIYDYYPVDNIFSGEYWTWKGKL